MPQTSAATVSTTGTFTAAVAIMSAAPPCRWEAPRVVHLRTRAVRLTGRTVRACAIPNAIGSRTTGWNL